MALDLEAIKGRDTRATPGPWEADGSEIVVSDSRKWIGETCRLHDDFSYDPQSSVDAEFVACARTDVPELVAEVERLEPLADAARLLGPARMVLDLAAVGTTALHSSLAANQQECADMAQRIVDLIGHPVTDEPPHAIVERDELRAEVEQLRADLRIANEATLVLVARATEAESTVQRMIAQADGAARRVAELEVRSLADEVRAAQEATRVLSDVSAVRDGEEPDPDEEPCRCCAGPGFGRGEHLHDEQTCEHPCCPARDE